MKKLFVLLIIIMLSACNAKEKVLYVGTNAEYKPYEYLENGKMKGFDIEYMQEIAKNLGYKIKWKNMTFDALLPAVQSGNLDIVIAGLGPTKERKKYVDFTDIYYKTKQKMIVNKAHTQINTLDQIKGKVIGVQLGTLQEQIAQKLGAKTKAYDSFTGAILDLNRKKIDGVILEDIVAIPYLENNKELHSSIDVPGKEGSAIVVKKGNKELLKMLNVQIDKIKGEKYDKLVTKYFGGKL